MMILLAAILVATVPTFPAMFGGPKPALKRLASVARSCGYPDAHVSRSSFGADVVALPAPPNTPDDDSPFMCVTKWVFAHPKARTGFIGNEAAGR